MRCNLHDYDIMEDARLETKLDNARNLLAMNLGTHEQISQAVDLPLETVQQLAEELKVPIEQ